MKFLRSRPQISPKNTPKAAYGDTSAIFVTGNRLLLQMLLSCQKSFEEFASFTDKRSPRALKVRGIIFNQNKGLARRIAHRMRGVCCIPYEDLEQEASIGLLKAIDRFDPYAGAAFSSFAVPYIKGVILHYLRDHGKQIKVPRRWQEEVASVRADTRRLIAEGLTITIDEVAELRGIPIDRWEQEKKAVSKQHIKDIDDYQDHLITEVDEPEMLDIEFIHDRLGRLDNPYRTCIAEHFIGELSAQKIADRRNKEFKSSGSHYRVSDRQVMTLIRQGIKQMREVNCG